MPFYTIMILIGFILGIVAGTMGSLTLTRKLGRKSQKSLIASSLFFKLTRYRATIYNIERETPKTISTIVYGEANDYADLIDVLQKQMGFPVSLAKDAAKYAMDIAKDNPLQEKLRVALQYIDGGEKKAVAEG